MKKSRKQKPYLKHIDGAMMIASTVHPLTALPQVLTIFSTQNASGVSLATWVGFIVIGTVFLTYGIAHRLYPIIISQILWFVVDFAVIIGIVLYS